MKPVRLFEFGGPDKLNYGDYPEPEIGADDVLVKVIATSVSRWDIKYRAGEGAPSETSKDLVGRIILRRWET